MIMKKILLLFVVVAITVFAGCSKEDSNDGLPKDPAVAAITQVLSGKFIGSLQSTTSPTETEELTFNPYLTAKEAVSIIDGRITVYGTAVVVKYYNDHLLEISENCYYSVNVDYKGENPTVSFYPYSESGEIDNKEDKRIITMLSNNSFKMRDYGLTDRNDKTFIKQ